MVKKKENNTLGVWSLILGIGSIVFCWAPILGILFGVIGIIFSNQQAKIFQNNVATAGKITGIIGLIFSIIYLVVMMTFLGYVLIGTATSSTI